MGARLGWHKSGGERFCGGQVLAEVALGASGRFPAFDALVTLTVRTSDGDERHGPFLPQGGYGDEAQCDSNRSPSPLLKRYQEEIWERQEKWRRVDPSTTEPREAPPPPRRF
jgi:hypothetical protein